VQDHRVEAEETAQPGRLAQMAGILEEAQGVVADVDVDFLGQAAALAFEGRIGILDADQVDLGIFHQGTGRNSHGLHLSQNSARNGYPSRIRIVQSQGLPILARIDPAVRLIYHKRMGIELWEHIGCWKVFLRNCLVRCQR